MQNQQLSGPKTLPGLSRNRPHDRQDPLRNVFLMPFCRMAGAYKTLQTSLLIVKRGF